MELFTPGHFIPLLIVVALLFFGWKQMPDMARSLGRSLRVFKTEIKGLSEDDKQREEAKAAAPALEAPRAELVKKDVPTANGAAKNIAPAGRPRPAPRPDAAAQRPSTGGQ